MKLRNFKFAQVGECLYILPASSNSALNTRRLTNQTNTPQNDF